MDHQQMSRPRYPGGQARSSLSEPGELLFYGLRNPLTAPKCARILVRCPSIWLGYTVLDHEVLPSWSAPRGGRTPPGQSCLSQLLGTPNNLSFRMGFPPPSRPRQLSSIYHKCVYMSIVV